MLYIYIYNMHTEKAYTTCPQAVHHHNYSSGFPVHKITAS